MNLAVIGETARWGDFRRGNDPYERDVEWVAENNRLLNDYFPNRSDEVIARYQSLGYFSTLGAPDYQVDGVTQSGGLVESGAELTFSADDLVYYTVDGSDPRLEGGGINPDAIAYTPSVTEARALVGPGSIWSYYDSPGGLGADWVDSSFDDSGWESGVGQFGYGEGDELTELDFGPDPQNKPITAYFRTTINVEPGDFVSGTFSILRDDGAVVYLNGVEIIRSNLPMGVIQHTTPAESAITGEDENVFVPFSFDTDLLQPGNNTFAVEIHQIHSRSSDLSFDAEVSVTEEVAVSDPYVLNISTNVKSRTFSGGDWSPVHDATFAIPVPQSELRITELYFNPAAPTTAEIDAGFTDNDDFEFIELFNPNLTGTINLSGVQLVDGVTFEFGDVDLLLGERAVVVEDVDAFMARFGDSVRVLGEWSGALNNGGESIELLDAASQPIHLFTYDDAAPWAVSPDGGGASLNVVDIDGDYNSSDNWNAGLPTPGSEAVLATSVLSAVVNDGSAQRSTVDSLVITLEGDVEIDADAISVIQRSDANGATGTAVGTTHTTAFDEATGNTVITITFTSSTRNSGGALIDGNYQLTIDHTKVRTVGSTLTLGQDYVFGGSDSDNFFAFYGDNNGDRQLNIFDLLAFRQTYLRSSGSAGFNPVLDSNNDGVINIFDLLAFRQRFGKSLPFA